MDEERHKQALELLGQVVELSKNTFFESGVCMCGPPMNVHGECDNHAPVDSGEYHGAQLMKRVETFLKDEKVDNYNVRVSRLEHGISVALSRLMDIHAPIWHRVSECQKVLKKILEG